MPSKWDEEERRTDEEQSFYYPDMASKSKSIAEPSHAPSPAKDMADLASWQRWGFPAGLVVGLLIGLFIGYLLFFTFTRAALEPHEPPGNATASMLLILLAKDDPVSGMLKVSKPRSNPWSPAPGGSQRMWIWHRWGFPFGLMIGVCLGTTIAYVSIWLFFKLVRILSGV
jgi:hypothetical protein